MEQLTTIDDPGGFGQSTMIGAMWRFRWVVALVVIAFGIFGMFLNLSRPVEYVATAGLIVEDPRASSVEVTDLGRQSTQDSERYLADQVEILRSNEAAEIAARQTGGAFSPIALLEARSITGDSTSNLIEISVSHASPENAKIGADALLSAYGQLRRNQVQAAAELALAELDALTVAIEGDLGAINERIGELIAADPDRIELEALVQDGVRELNRLRNQRETLTLGSDERVVLDQQIAQLLREFETWRVVLDIRLDDGPMSILLAEQEAAITGRAALAARRNAIAVDAELAAVRVTLASPALLPEKPAGISDPLVMASSLLLGLTVAAVLAYFLSLRDQKLTTREFPELVLGAPLLAQVPDFTHEGISSSLPVKMAQASSAAEAFRFAAAAIDIRASATRTRIVSVVSAGAGNGKTTMVANAGFAAARSGKRVLLVDGDLADQKLTSILTDDAPSHVLTEVINCGIHLSEVPVDVSIDQAQSLSLLSRGKQKVEAVTFDQSIFTREFFAQLASSYDLVLVDCPPLLHVAYASTLASYADASLVVIEHQSGVEQLSDLADQLRLIGTPVLGYVYTKAPLRRGMAAVVSSTVNSLESSLMAEPREPQSRSSWMRAPSPRT